MWIPTTQENVVGGGGGNLITIGDSTLGADTASFDFTSISGLYAHLLVILNARCTFAVTAAVPFVTFNNDSAANYAYHYIQANQATVTAVDSHAQSNVQMGVVPGANAPANYFSECVMEISDYANSARYKACLWRGGGMGNSVAANDNYYRSGHGLWLSTAAINRITVSPSAGNWLAGSRCTVYALDVS